MRRLFVVFALAAAALGVASSAAAVADFVTPARAAYCAISEGEPPIRLICWRPADGLTLDMNRNGSARKEIHRANRGYYDPAPGRPPLRTDVEVHRPLELREPGYGIDLHEPLRTRLVAWASARLQAVLVKRASRRQGAHGRRG